MQASNQLLDVVKKFEGLSLKPYLDSGGIPTIGYGCTRYEDGTKVTMQDPQITLERATQLFMYHIQNTQNAVLATFNFMQSVLSNFNKQWIFDSLVDLTYNVGITNVQFRKDHISTHLVTYFNQGKITMARQELLNGWDTDEQGHRLAGLVKRREFDYNVWGGNYKYPY